MMVAERKEIIDARHCERSEAISLESKLIFIYGDCFAFSHERALVLAVTWIF